jgi:predicted transcriptional regulator
MNIFAAKIRGARAMAQLSQAELAGAAELSVPAVQRVESGETSPNSRTQTKLIRVLEEAGIKFTNTGAEIDDSPIIFLRDDDPSKAYIKLLQDVSDHLKTHKKPELLISNADDKVSPDAVNTLYRIIRDNGVKMRQLVEDGNSYLMGEIEEYRYIPKENFINRVTLIYGDRVATLTDEGKTVSINRDPINADTRRNLFNLLWKTLEQPTESKADERF